VHASDYCGKETTDRSERREQEGRKRSRRGYLKSCSGDFIMFINRYYKLREVVIYEE
jgi:hypothetical protein